MAARIVSPMHADDRLTRNLKIVSLIMLSLALAWIIIVFLGKILPVVIVLLGAMFFAYLVYPAVRWLTVRRWPRWLAILYVYAVLGLIVGAVVVYIAPTITAQTQTLTHDLPSLVSQIKNGLTNANISVLAAVPLEARQTAANLIGQITLDIQNATGSFAGHALQILLSVASIITGVVIVPFLAFYILLDAERLREGVLQIFPARFRRQTLVILGDVDTVVGGFIRGQLIVAACVAILVSIWLMVLRVKYALLIGIFAGLVDIIPYVGAVAGAIPAVLIAIFTHGPLWGLIVAAGFVAIYEVEGHVVAPAVVGQRVGIPPLMVIVAILVGAELGGIGGMFVAVPLAGIIRVLWRRLTQPTVVVEPAAPGIAQPPAPSPLLVAKE